MGRLAARISFFVLLDPGGLPSTISENRDAREIFNLGIGDFCFGGESFEEIPRGSIKISFRIFPNLNFTALFSTLEALKRLN